MAESGYAGLLDLFCGFPDPERRQGDEQYVLIRVEIVFVILILSSGPHWGMYGETKVRFQALLNGMKYSNDCTGSIGA